MIEEPKLINLHFKGLKFTWENKRKSGMIRERIERALVNMLRVKSYPKSQVVNLPMVGSDHAPLLVDTDVKEKWGPKQFKFKILWTQNDECGQISLRFDGRLVFSGLGHISW